jgi:hypothetical protein
MWMSRTLVSATNTATNPNMTSQHLEEPSTDWLNTVATAPQTTQTTNAQAKSCANEN